MIRFLLAVLYVVLFLILTIPVMIVEHFVGKKHPERKDKTSKAIVSWGFRCVQHISGVDLVVSGQENIPKDTAVLYVGNHRSFFDVVLTLSLFPRITGYVAKIELKKVPLLNIWMSNIHCLFLDRENIKEGLKTILTGVSEVKNGISLCIFPEGTRNKEEGTLLPFHEGSFKIAEKGGVPIVPMTILNSAAVFEDHLPKIKKAKVVIDFGTPIDLKELDKDTKKNLGTYVSDIIMNRYNELKEMHYN